ncbi:MAG TPA: hypothetical protein ENH84_06725 [Phycisphaerae bacterium]|nr:hypothetical protein [Phycisphaerae bacterium]
MTRTVILTAGVLWMLTGAGIDAWGQDQGRSHLLGKRYTDPLNGFALCPPREAQRVETKHPVYLAQWLPRNAATAETIWSLNVYRATLENAQTDIKSYAKGLASQIEKQSGAKVESTRFVTVAGKSAVSFAGKMTDRSQIGSGGVQTDLPDMLFRQGWIPTDPGKFLVIEWFVPTSQKPLIQPTWEAILASVRFHDPEAAIREQKENVKRSQKLLWEKITPQKLQAAMPTAPKWFLVYQGKKAVGWIRVQARSVRMNQAAGFEIRTWAMYQIPKQKIRLVRQSMFTNSKFSLEKWGTRIQIGSGPDAILMAEEGVRQGGLVLCTFSGSQRHRNTQKKLPESVKDIYLPKALGMVLPALVDQGEKATYTFAEYAGAENDFHMRTLTVVGPERIKSNGRWVKAVKMTDQPSIGADPIVFWVDEKGNVLRSQTPDGLRSESATPEAVLRTYPKAKLIVVEMNRSARSARKGPENK